MKIMSIRIKGREESWKDFDAAWSAAAKVLPFKPRGGVYFTSLDAVRNFLTPKRLILLHLIKEKKPRSLSALARLAGRSFPGIFRGVETLKRHGMVKLDKTGASPRSKVCPRVEYDELDVKIAV